MKYLRISNGINNIIKSLINVALAIEQMLSLNFRGECTIAIDAFVFRRRQRSKPLSQLIF